MPPVLAEFGVVQPAELVGVMVEPVGGALHLVKVMTVLAGGRFLLAPLTHNAQLFPAQRLSSLPGVVRSPAGTRASPASPVSRTLTRATATMWH